MSRTSDKRGRPSASEFMDYDGDDVKDVNSRRSRSKSPNDKGYRGDRYGSSRYDNDYKRKNRNSHSDEFGRSRDRSRGVDGDRERDRNSDTRRERGGSYRERSRERGGYRERSRERGREGRDWNRDKSNDSARGRTAKKSNEVNDKKINEEKSNGQLESTSSNSEDPEELMRQMMGFSGFSTTKNKKVIGADVSGVAKVKPSGFRQYMNRSGGFNRDLSPSPE